MPGRMAQQTKRHNNRNKTSKQKQTTIPNKKPANLLLHNSTSHSRSTPRSLPSLTLPSLIPLTIKEIPNAPKPDGLCLHLYSTVQVVSKGATNKKPAWLLLFLLFWLMNFWFLNDTWLMLFLNESFRPHWLSRFDRFQDALRCPFVSTSMQPNVLCVGCLGLCFGHLS